MKLSEFDFHLPEELIATHPLEDKESARLLYVPSSSQLEDKKIKDIPSFLRPGDVLVLNDTKVIPARIFARRGETKIELMLHKRLQEDGENWLCFAKPAKKTQIGDILKIADGFEAKVIEKNEGGEITVSFNVIGPKFHQALAENGETPLPPYIMKKRKADDGDVIDYQTVFAKHEGAVAAPTAGLHFSDEMLKLLQKNGVKICFVTLHVGAGTFLPVKVDDIKEHKMHAEWYEISDESAEILNKAKDNGGRIIACGTTALRTLEAVSIEHGKITACSGETDIFITPGYEFKIVDILLTNFHTPKSTLFMLVCAFSGEEKVKSAYTHAIKNSYRFYSYGDACLLEKANIT